MSELVTTMIVSGLGGLALGFLGLSLGLTIFLAIVWGSLVGIAVHQIYNG